MSRTVFNQVAIAAFSVLLAGCGLVQTVTDASRSTLKSVFYPPIKTLHLDFSGRASVNADRSEMVSLSVPTLVRVYQLRDNRSVERAGYDRLVRNDESVLAGSLLDSRSLVVRPEEGAQLNVPLDADARYVVVAALFRQPDVENGTWRMTLHRDELDPDRPRTIELRDNQVTLRPLAED